MKLFRTTLLTLLATLVLLPCLSSCSDDDEKFDWSKAEEMLIGQWKLGDDYVDENEIAILTLNADHTGTMDDSVEETAHFTWSYDTTTHNITLTIGDQSILFGKVVTISCCELGIHLNGEDALFIFERLN